MKKLAIIIGVIFFSAGNSMAQDVMELIKSDINKEKRSILEEALDIKKENETSFWQIYAEYEEASNKLVDMRAGNIKKFADNYVNLTEEIADEIASSYLEIESGRLKNKKTYYKKMKKVIGSIQATRFMQIMGRIQLVIDVQVAEEVPLLE